MGSNKENTAAVEAQFEVEGLGKFKFTFPLFIVPGKNNNEPISAEEALQDEEILAYLVENKSSVIEKIKE